MNITNENGIISEIEYGGVRVPFGKGLGPSFYVKKELLQEKVALHTEKCACGGEKYVGTFDGIEFSLSYTDCGDYMTINASIENQTEKDYAPEAIGLKLGIDSYMESYPEWNEKFFPTFLRCEKTHFWGYFMSPLKKIVAVTCTSPVAAWELDYNTLGKIDDTRDDGHYGHRIFTGNLLLICRGPLPERHPQGLSVLPAGRKIEWKINLMPLPDVSLFSEKVSDKFGIPVIDFDRYTFTRGETVHAKVLCGEKYEFTVTDPIGKVSHDEVITSDRTGMYRATVKTASGLVSEALVFCRRPYRYYLEEARRNAVFMPQKATTHTESWYGHFSNFLARKHYPSEFLDEKALANLEEILPLMYNTETGEPIVIPERIQNTALMISLMCDVYEAGVGGRKYLDLADKMADFLIARQHEDGAYYRNGREHYTAVIYIAKSMLELAFAEKTLADDSAFAARYEKHYASAGRAVDNLRDMLETIGTEGEHTLEDGMISCSALQLGYFALTLPENERKPYIDAAEHLISIHRCLEQQIIPDCRMRGATLRFWEAQYDVMIRGNMMNSPHGWTSWKNYATYYLYLLTGKEEYLRDTVDTLGACMQMIDENGTLRWAFVSDPYLNVRRLVPDTSKPVSDGYESSKFLTTPAYRGKYERQVFGECYIDMTAGWYRNCPESRLCGGFPSCPTIYKDCEIMGDNQGGACDNDVHEHFKCLEETLLEKAFVLVRDDESVLAYNCEATLAGGRLLVNPLEHCTLLHINSPFDLSVTVGERKFATKRGMDFYQI